MTDWTEFDRCKKLLEDALEYNNTGQTLEDVKRGLHSGEYILWPGENSVVVTEHFDGPLGKFLNFFLAAGEMSELEAMLPGIEAYAKLSGVSRITLYGRRGWERSFLRDQGYKPHFVVMTKEI